MYVQEEDENDKLSGLIKMHLSIELKYILKGLG